MIKTVADVVGTEHPVDLKNYDILINVMVIQVSLEKTNALQVLMVNIPCHRMLLVSVSQEAIMSS